MRTLLHPSCLVPVKGPEVGQNFILASFHVVTINLNQSK